MRKKWNKNFNNDCDDVSSLQEAVIPVWATSRVTRVLVSLCSVNFMQLYNCVEIWCYNNFNEKIILTKNLNFFVL